MARSRPLFTPRAGPLTRNVLANPELGTKQICPNCQTKFYDLTRRPAHCPKCGLDFDPEDALRSRRTRVRTSPADYADDEPKSAPVRDEDESEDDAAEATPELDAAAVTAPAAGDEDDDTAEPAGDTPADDAAGFSEEEEEEADDVPFLEESEEELGDDDLDLPAEPDDER